MLWGFRAGIHPELSYAGLLPGASQTDTLPISYRGTIPGDLALELRPQGGSAYCGQGSGGSWSALDGGLLQLSLDGGNWLDYCSLLDAGASIPVAFDVPPGTDLDVEVGSSSPGTDHRFSQLSDVDALTVTARQSGVGAFTDWAEGTITIGTA